MPDHPDAVNPVGPPNPGPPAPPPESHGEPGRSGRGYRLASGEDVVLELDAPNVQFFDGEAVCDPVELAKLTKRSTQGD